MRCAHCSKTIDDNSQFCKYCGGEVAEKKEMADAPKPLEKEKPKNEMAQKVNTVVQSQAYRKFFWYLCIVNIVFSLLAMQKGGQLPYVGLVFGISGLFFFGNRPKQKK